MSFVRGGGKQGNKQQLINGLLGFKLKIQERDVREHLYAQYLAVRHTHTRAHAHTHTHTWDAQPGTRPCLQRLHTAVPAAADAVLSAALQRCAKMYEQSAFAARGDVLKAIKLGGGAAMLKKSPTPNAR